MDIVPEISINVPPFCNIFRVNETSSSSSISFSVGFTLKSNALDVNVKSPGALLTAVIPKDAAFILKTNNRLISFKVVAVTVPTSEESSPIVTVYGT